MKIQRPPVRERPPIFLKAKPVPTPIKVVSPFSLNKADFDKRDLGDDTTDAIVKNVLDIASSIWPQGTAEFENWVDSKLSEFGISYAQYRAQQLSSGLSQYSNWIWLGVGAIILWKVL